MLIKQIYLDGFRQFYPPQTLSFSTNPNKKVTLVLAESGVGKTTIIQAFKWAFYGGAKYQNVLNEELKSNLRPDEYKIVEVIVELIHNNITYQIKRTQKFYKKGSQLRADDSVLTIDYKDINGNSKQVKNRDANKIILDIMQEDLFSYFFLEGENLSKYGSSMSKKTNLTNKSFSKAVKGLLGFNVYYDAINHLRRVSDDYNSQIGLNTTNQILSSLIAKNNEKENELYKAKDDNIKYQKEVEYYKDLVDKISDELAEYSAIEEQEKRKKSLEATQRTLLTNIASTKAELFKLISSNSVYYFMNNLSPKITDMLANNKDIDEGIPDVTVDTIEYLLKSHKCICGNKIEENSKEWQILENLKAYVRPNNIAHEITTLKRDLLDINTKSSSFYSQYKERRRKINNDIKQLTDVESELKEIREKVIGDIDIDSRKKKRNEYEDKIRDFNLKIDRNDSLINRLENEIKENKNKIDELKEKDNKTKKIQAYLECSEYARKYIQNWCKREEDKKRQQLEDYINEIFREFYKEEIILKLDENYVVNITTNSNELTSDFTSGGQDVTLALAFIGAVVKLKSEPNKEKGEMEDMDNVEAYPLIMDAPTSNFGMKQMDSFSQIMPKLTNQIIVLINDKDGPILKEKMSEQIGKEWSIKKLSTYKCYVFGGQPNDK